jgi:hypothetical protein
MASLSTDVAGDVVAEAATSVAVAAMALKRPDVAVGVAATGFAPSSHRIASCESVVSVSR